MLYRLQYTCGPLTVNVLYKCSFVYLYSIEVSCVYLCFFFFFSLSRRRFRLFFIFPSGHNGGPWCWVPRGLVMIFRTWNVTPSHFDQSHYISILLLVVINLIQEHVNCNFHSFKCASFQVGIWGMKWWVWDGSSTRRESSSSRIYILNVNMQKSNTTTFSLRVIPQILFVFLYHSDG